MAARSSYNERLFSGDSLRRSYHLARFTWARRKFKSDLGKGLSLIELGCYDGRLFETVAPQVKRYVGLDANWEGGLDLARRKFAGNAAIELVETSDPASLDRFADGEFDVAAALETLEHIDPGTLPRFLDQLARVTRGHLLVTVPNEMGPLFLAKYLGQRLLYGSAEPYTPREFIAALLRRPQAIERNQHKGFDYRALIRAIGERFDVLSVEGIPATGLPPALSPTIGIVAASRAGA